MANIKVAVAIAEFKYPPEKNTLVLIIDQSSCTRLTLKILSLPAE